MENCTAREDEKQLNIENPYQAPTTTDVVSPQANQADIETLKKFRRQIHAIGGFWIFIGLVVLGIGVSLAVNVGTTGDQTNGWDLGASAVVCAAGTAWIGIGIMSCLKQIWAVYTGLVLSYIMGGLGLLSLSLCGIVILAAVIFQAHRVIAWAGELKMSGVPLSTKP